tara:strand:+ start:2076 stop:2522 length:447 start_codon:yes stop_codon:yes gene_type:complete
MRQNIKEDCHTTNEKATYLERIQNATTLRTQFHLFTQLILAGLQVCKFAFALLSASNLFLGISLGLLELSHQLFATLCLFLKKKLNLFQRLVQKEWVSFVETQYAQLCKIDKPLSQKDPSPSWRELLAQLFSFPAQDRRGLAIPKNKI